MDTFLKTIQFSKVYLKRYWFRFITGIVLGILFAMSYGLFLGSAYTMLYRLSDPDKVAEVTAQGRNNQDLAQKKEEPEGGVAGSLNQTREALKEKLYVTIDPWLPVRGQPLDWKRSFGCLFLLPAIAALRGFLSYGSSYLMAWSGQRITNDVKVDVFRKVSSLSLDFFHRTTTAELISRIESDSAGLNTFLRLGLSDLVKEPATILVIFGTMLCIDWKFTLISVAFLPICLVPMRKVGKRLKVLGRQDFSNLMGQSNITMESFMNVRITKAYALEEEHARSFFQAGQRSARFNMKSLQSRELLNPIVQTLSALGIGCVLLYAIWIKCDPATLAAFFGALILIQSPVKKLSSVGVYMTQLNLSLERLMELLSFQPSVKEDPHPVALTRFSRGIEFKHVDFSYGDSPVLQDVSFELVRGRRLGLAGESGSGKSSLLNLLFRFYDVTGGVIEIDGVPIERYRLADLRAQLALVSQDILLFNATVAENIGFGKIGASREEIEEAARRAHASHFIKDLPRGYDTPLGERGIRLSGGQRQRIAIARAFVRNAPILVLDEATASLDSKSEEEVQGAIDELTENRTVVCVAHRLSTLRTMDHILVMEKGRVVEQGSFDELLRQDRLFAAMAARQSIFHQAA